ncbi:hypothetical protein QGM71_12830 [Virgibacillus sp. C22-A2]|uniref:Aspartate phosphatase n=1 Tax=Virgibacillus tibetensis TaxID=3042313 RepID=A0ABU6KGE9_9BACI|nr:hypothetical protein [Virgibacillus sp. C22-A2]
MKKVLIALFAVLIISFGIFGYTKADETNEIINENGHSTTITS